MLKLLKFVEYVWVGMGFLCAYQLFMTWNIEGNPRYIFAGGLVLSIFMFFFRRRTRKHMEQLKAQQQQQQQQERSEETKQD